MREYGFDLNLAPVADVNTNPKNIVIGNRSFGNDPNLVSEMVRAYIEGLHSAGVLSCTKHFPGHGDTTSDTHTGRVVLYKTWDELLTSELIPFKETMDETDIIMIAHITLPEVTGDGLPASMSGELIQGKLRGELGYDGVVVTDSMAMKAVADYYGPGEAAITAIEAGADIVLMPFDYKEAFDAVYDAVLSGRLSEERIDVSVCRILKLKIVN